MRIEIWYKEQVGDGRKKSVIDLLSSKDYEVNDVQIRDIYLILGIQGLSEQQFLDLICDPISQNSVIINNHSQIDKGKKEFDLLLEVSVNPGVTDPVAITLREAISEVLGIKVSSSAIVQTARQYRFYGELKKSSVRKLYNPLIQTAIIYDSDQLKSGKYPPLHYPSINEGDRSSPCIPNVTSFSIAKMSDSELISLSEERLLALNTFEMEAIRSYYRNETTKEKRSKAGISINASDVELEILAQTWSEHCKHKIFNAKITYYDGSKKEVIHSLFDTYIKSTTFEVDTKKEFLRSVFHDDSGVIEFDSSNLLCFKVETHNSPAALDPYGGAITGIVGVNRDILGTGKSARPIFNTNVLCFAPPSQSFHKGLTPPRQVLDGVHKGIIDGGNQSGIPTVAGAFLFDPSFIGKPLVFCGTGGILPAYIGTEPAWEASANPGDLAVMIGGRIGRDGIHGATFSSLALSDDSPLSAVQIGDPITQKKFADFLIEARDQQLFRSLTDNGAGGLSSSFGEMARETNGIRLDLTCAPLKYQGLLPWEIMVSESQERMSLAVPPENYKILKALARLHSVEISLLGEFTNTGNLEVFYNDKLVALLELEFLHEGLPLMSLKAQWNKTFVNEPSSSISVSLTKFDHHKTLLQLLSEPNIASKEGLVRQYDHEVQAMTVGKPFVGVRMDGPSDGAVLKPLLSSNRGIIVTHGICPWYSKEDTFHMAQCAVDEAVRAFVACGGDLSQIAALDNFCWPDPVKSLNNPDGEYKLAQLVRAAKGLRLACLAYQLPIISGKDSMKNDAIVSGKKISVLPTLLISLIGIIEDVEKSVSTDFKTPGDVVFVIGQDRGELRASSYERCFYSESSYSGLFSSIPTVDLENTKKSYHSLHLAMRSGWVSSAHDISDGGLGVAIAESAIGGRLGVKFDLSLLKRSASGFFSSSFSQADIITMAMFSETAGRLIVTVPPEHVKDFCHLFEDNQISSIGSITDDQKMRLSFNGNRVATWGINELIEKWHTKI